VGEYGTKKVKDVRVGDFVMIPGAPPFKVGRTPSWVGGPPGSREGYVLVEGRTRLGRKTSATLFAWHHTVLIVGDGQD
jgi:hypothetical protein